MLRPCVVAGPRATALADTMPWRRAADRLPAVVRTALGRVPGIRMVVPDPGGRLQLVHHDDVAAAIAAATLGRGRPGAYNLAADGTVGFAAKRDLGRLPRHTGEQTLTAMAGAR